MRNVIILGLLALLVSTSCKEQKTTTTELGNFLSQCEDLGLFNGSVLVMQRGEKIFEGSYGYKNFETREKNTNESKYRAFSITKSFTATVIFQLEEEGKISLDDKLSKFYPDFPYGDSISITNLLGHTSGLANETNTDNTKDEETFIKFMASKKLDFSPNTKWSYSNSNYYILGYIIKKITGQEYDKEIEQRILKPLGMNNSGFHFAELQDENKTIGYRMITKDNAAKAFEFKTDHPFAAGALYSTTDDMYKFSEAIKNNTLLKEETLAKASVLQHGSEFGLGLMFDSIFDKKQIGHSGGGPGYVAHWRRIIEDDITFIFFINNESVSGAIVQNMYRIILNMPYDKPNALALSPENLKKVKGTYVEGDKEFYLSDIDGSLIFSEQYGGNCALYPISDTLFMLGHDVSVSLKADSLILNIRNERFIRAKKTEVPYVWGIVGDATPSGWDGKDIPMVADADAPTVWRLHNYKLKKGGLVFRMNNGWANNITLSADGEVSSGGYHMEIEGGMYDIMLDVTDRFNPKYEIKKLD